MKKRLYKITSMALVLMLLLSCFAPTTMAVEQTDDEGEVTTYTIYYRHSPNNASSNILPVYCLMWNDSPFTMNKAFPGVEMTYNYSTGLYSCTSSIQYENCIFCFSCSDNTYSQTGDLDARYGYVYNGYERVWKLYETSPTTAPVATSKPPVAPTTIEPTEPLSTTNPTEPPAPEYISIIGDIKLGLVESGADIYTGTVELEVGSYAFKVDESGTEMGLGYTFTDTMTNITYSSAYKSSTILNATGGYYTFKYNVSTNRLTVSYKPYPTDPTEPPTTEPIYTDPIPTVPDTSAPIPTEPITTIPQTTQLVTAPDDNRYHPAEGVETYRYYFYMPSDWYNECADTVYIFWWEGTGARNSWPGYNVYNADVENIYYCDVPRDVTTILWNNGVNYYINVPYDKYGKFSDTKSFNTEYYEPGESPLYPNGINNFDNMIYVLDSNKIIINEYTGTKTYDGEWYYYYGNGEYGVQPTRAEAVANGALYNTEYQPPKGTVEPTEPVPDDNKYRPAEDVETYRYYFYMPSDWYNEYADTANIYWWAGTDACDKWTGYNAYEGDVANIYYCDVPQDVATIIWNNGLDGGEDTTSDKYLKALQTVGIGSEYYDPGESPLYPKGTYNFDNMIYVLDPNKIDISEFSGRTMYGGDWYYYYGNGEYGVYPTRAEAVANGALYNTEYQPPKVNPAPVKDELTVNATSNFFTSQTATYNRKTRELTVTYYIDAEKDMLNTQWELTYDPAILTVSSEKNTRDSVSPEFKQNRVLTFNDGKIKCNTYNLSLYDISSEEKVFARVVFDVNDFRALGVYDTTINLNVQHLTLSSLDDETGISDMNEEVRVVYNGAYDDSDGLINTARTEFDSIEIPEFIGDVDGSGEINIHDATLLAKYLVDYAELDEGQLLVSDCDNDGVVTIKDVTCIQLYIADAVNSGNTGNKYI